MNFSVALVGAGNMGGAMLRGWINNGMDPANITVIDPSPSEQMQDFLARNSVGHAVSADDVPPPNVLLVAIKPQMMDAVLPGLTGLVGENTVVVSVAAGTQLATLERALGNPAAIRAMPNTPALVLRGMTVLCANGNVSNDQKQQVADLLLAIGAVEWIDDEALMDAVTAVSGSGPAYLFHLAECMAAAGEKAGLPKELAMTLAIETVSGAGELMRQSDETPAQLRQNVTSPNGTTAAALEVLMADDGMPELLEKAIEAAAKRSRELS